MCEEERYLEAVRLYRETNLKRVELCRQLALDYDAFTYFLKTRFPELINRHPKKKTSGYIKEQRRETDARYRKALKLCENPDLTYKEIAEQTNVSLEGLKTYIRTYHRDLMLRRKGVKVSKRAANNVKIRKRESGQTIFGRERYREAIEACDDINFIHLTVSEIAQEFDVPATGLLAQLREHYPDISERREKERFARGIGQNTPRGVRKSTEEQYKPALEMLQNSDLTIEKVAEECGVSLPGFKSYLLAYHKDLVEKRRKKSEGKYDAAIEEFKNSSLNFKEIAERHGLVYNSFASYCRRNGIVKNPEFLSIEPTLIKAGARSR